MTNSDKLRAELETLTEAENWDGCLRLFRLLERERALTADELVQKSSCAQLGPELGSLEEAETALKAALDIADGYIPALLALGWFHYAVQDDAAAGLSYFTKAEELSQTSLKEALEGKKKCLDELQEDRANG